jgi:type II secretory pathway pseudopilin PulG
MNQSRDDPRAGITLVEVLVILSILTLLLALILPAVQGAREAARRTQCRNNLRQLALAALAHETTHGHFPGNGWGYAWVGEPGRGNGKRQPGGWLWSALPHLDRLDLWQLGRDDTGQARLWAMAARARTPLAVVTCPTRRSAELVRANPSVLPRNAHWSPLVATTDYAINEGDWISDTRQGPTTLAEGDDPQYVWKDMTPATGISFLRSEIRSSMIRDGLGHTYLIGEKMLSGTLRDDGYDLGHDQSMFSGVDLDVARWTIDPPAPDGTPAPLPRQFGSAHAGICHMALCDGAVRPISFGIDREVHRRLGTRAEGTPVADDSF